MLAVAALHSCWNADAVPPLQGYDAGGHAGYMLSIAETGELPHPYSGWSSFHPPLYHGIGAVFWRVLEPLGPRALRIGLRGISAASLLMIGALCFVLVLRRNSDWRLATVAAALVLFLPAASMAASSLGNEALGAACAALALPCLLRLQDDPGQLRHAALAGLFAGLAMATKYSGAFVAVACAVPFLRSDLDRRGMRALALCALVGALLAAPFYARNIQLTGSPFPMTRDREPMKSTEAWFERRPRQPRDYLWIPADVWLQPRILLEAEAEGRPRVNEAMQSVWGLVYASLWYDPFGHRIAAQTHRQRPWQGPLLLGLGLLPTGLLLRGTAIASREAVRSRGRTPDTVLVVMIGVGLSSLVAFSVHAPSLVAVKGSYLLPLLAPAALLFARGFEGLPARLRGLALGGCALAVLAAAATFSSGLLQPPAEDHLENWQRIGAQLPESYIREAVVRLRSGE